MLGFVKKKFWRFDFSCEKETWYLGDFMSHLYADHPFSSLKNPHKGDFWVINGANDGTRTHDLILTKDALYQLSYAGLYTK